MCILNFHLLRKWKELGSRIEFPLPHFLLQAQVIEIPTENTEYESLTLKTAPNEPHLLLFTQCGVLPPQTQAGPVKPTKYGKSDSERPLGKVIKALRLLKAIAQREVSNPIKLS